VLRVMMSAALGGVVRPPPGMSRGVVAQATAAGQLICL